MKGPFGGSEVTSSSVLREFVRERSDTGQWKDVADKAGITLGDLESLLRGSVSFEVQERLGVPMGYIEDYINKNEASADFETLLGFHMAAAESLGAALGREGRIGLIVGLLIN